MNTAKAISKAMSGVLIYALQSMQPETYDKINGFQVFRDGPYTWEVCGSDGQAEVMTLGGAVQKLGG